jgi:hypothetical protein
VARWQRLRGQAVTVAPAFLERLQSRKAQVGESLERQRAARKFEGDEAPAGPVPTAGGAPSASAPTSQAPAPPPVAPAKEEDPVDYASRLLKAKKRSIEEREKKNKPGQ